MAKELPFFKFEVSEWMFGRIQKQPLSVQGSFINLCCKYWHKLGELSSDDAVLDFGEDNIQALVKSKIIGIDGDFIFIKFLDRQLDECELTSKKNSIKGLKSAEVRALRRKQQLTTVEPQLTGVQPNPTEEKRREEKREDLPVSPFFKPTIEPYKQPDTYPTGEIAFKEIQADELYVEQILKLIKRKGFKIATELTVVERLKEFLTIEQAKPNFDCRARNEVREHFVNWINKTTKVA